MRRDLAGTLLWAQAGAVPCAATGLGLTLGLALVLLALQACLDLRQVLGLEEARREAFVILTKRVTAARLQGAGLTFSEAEVSALRQASTVTGVAEFRAPRFGARAALFGLETELFFEAVPVEFLDETPEGWRWRPGDPVVPVMLSADFLTLYNFAFAPTQGLPPLSRETVEMLPFRTVLSGGGRTVTVTARVVGFSRRIPSILVPLEFLEWANARLGGASREQSGPRRLMVRVRDPDASAFRRFLDDEGLESNRERGQAAQIYRVARLGAAAVAVLGAGLVCLSLLTALVQVQLILSRAREEIAVLLMLGYTRRRIAGILGRGAAVVLGVAAVTAGALVWCATALLQRELAALGMCVGEGASGVRPAVLGAAAGAIALTVVLLQAGIHRAVRKP